MAAPLASRWASPAVMRPLPAAIGLGIGVGILAYGAALVILRTIGVLVAGGVEQSWGTNHVAALVAVAAIAADLAWLRIAWPRDGRARQGLIAVAVATASGLYSVLAFAEMHLGSTVTVERGTWPAIGELVLLHASGVWICFAALARIRQLRPSPGAVPQRVNETTKEM